MHSLVTVVTVLRWLVAAFFVLCILHPARAESISMTGRDTPIAIHARVSSCGSGYITAYYYPPTGRRL